MEREQIGGMDAILSHVVQRGDGSWEIQSNDDHQRSVAEMASRFALPFGMADWAWEAGILHDRGKERKSFQQYIRKNSGLEKGPFPGGIPEHNHAYVGGLLARSLYGPNAVAFLANAIVSHHTGLHDADELPVILEKPLPPEVRTDNLPKRELKAALRMRPTPQEFHHIARMLFSCLVDADFLDTEQFMDPAAAASRQGHATLPELLPRLEEYLADLQKSAPDTPLNQLRNKILRRCRESGENSPQGAYSLTVPTGGGKTLASLAWAMRHAIQNGQKRILIAIPYTSIIVQTAGILKKIFGPENVLEHHSAFDWDEVSDENQKAHLLRSLENWDCPIVVTTNVCFFESLFANRPGACRKLHNILDSVILFDEAQMLPTGFLRPILEGLKTCIRLFHVSVLFMTASQPVLCGPIRGANPIASFAGMEKVQEIIPPDWELHRQLKRAKIQVDAQEKNYDELAAELAGYPRVLCIVNTRKDAKELWDRLPRKGEGVAIHLSRMMCPRHVSEKLQELRDAMANLAEPVVRCIATQLVEAGVDLDFPVVFRQEAGLDSVLQAAGRCNREGRLPAEQAMTHVFRIQDRPLPRGSISAANNARLALPPDADPQAPETMTEYFRQLYCRANSFDVKEIQQRLQNPADIPFKTVAKDFQLIQDNGIPVIVNWKEAADLVVRLKKNGPSYDLMRKLGDYTVTIPGRDFAGLQKEGFIEEVWEKIYFIRDPKQYDDTAGLRLDNHWPDEILMY